MENIFHWLKTEFFTLRRFLFNFLFYGAHLGLFAYGWFAQETDQRLFLLNSLTWSVWTSRGAGLVLALDGGLIILPMLRNLIRLIRPGAKWILDTDESIWFHRQVAYSLIFWSAIHTTAHYVNFFNVERTQVRPQTAQDIHYTQAGGLSGHFMLLILLLVATTAHNQIRKQSFEVFWYSHHITFFFMIGLYAHATGCFVRDTADPDYIRSFPFYSADHCLGYFSWRYIIWPGLLYFCERAYRDIRGRRYTALEKAYIHPSGVIELHMNKPGFSYVPGQWVFLQIPELSRFQWHPFTITSAPDDDYISLHIRQVGDWTRSLGERLSASNETVAATNKDKDMEEDLFEVDLPLRGLPLVRIDGPYGAPAEDVFEKEVAILIAAGIGVTPFASILKHIWHRQTRKNVGVLRRVEFFWICRDVPSFGWFQHLLKRLERAQANPNFLRINIYLTQKISEDMLWNITVNDAGSQYDPLTRLRSRTFFGRPDWNAVYGNIKKSIEAGDYVAGSTAQLKTHVGTYFCGPGPLGTVVKAAAKAHDCSTIEFSFVKEHF